MVAQGVEALVFDVFGTVVDWRGSIVAEGEGINRAKALNVDWGAVADAWRGRYQPSMRRVMSGEVPWANLDALHRASLEEVLREFGIDAFSEAEKADLNRVWHRLRPWPDAVEGLTRLKHRYIIAPLSNGNVALLTEMAKTAGLPWDLILSAELARAYKPDPRAYLTAVELLMRRPEQVMMVAAHQDDLRAAQSQGLQAGFVRRPLEFGPERRPDQTADPSFAVVASDFLDLARQLGA